MTSLLHQTILSSASLHVVGSFENVVNVFVILEIEKTIESFEKYDVLRLWLG